MKPKHCAHCGTLFTPMLPLAKVCSPACAMKYTRAKKAQDKRALRERKAALKTIPDLIKEAQKEFNKWVRTRDEAQPCISCGAPALHGSGYQGGRDAGHWRSVGSASHLRFHEDNCHAQCVACNKWGAGRAVEYRVGLIQRIGLARVEALESNNEPHKWQREELIAIRDKYRAKTKELLKEKT